MTQTYIPDSEMLQLTNIIAVIQDPKKYQAALAEIAKRHDDLVQQVANANAVNQQARQSQLDAEQKQREVEALKASVDQVKALQDQEASRLSTLANQLSEKDISLSKRAQQLSASEALISQREASMKEVEREVSQRLSLAEATLDDAKKTKAILDLKVAKLKELADG